MFLKKYNLKFQTSIVDKTRDCFMIENFTFENKHIYRIKSNIIFCIVLGNCFTEYAILGGGKRKEIQ